MNRVEGREVSVLTSRPHGGQEAFACLALSASLGNLSFRALMSTPPRLSESGSSAGAGVGSVWALPALRLALALGFLAFGLGSDSCSDSRAASAACWAFNFFSARSAARSMRFWRSTRASARALATVLSPRPGVLSTSFCAR